MISGFFIYVYIVIGLLVLYFDTPKRQPKGYDSFFKAVFVLLALLVAFRYKVGPDTARYMVNFNDTPPLYQLAVKDFNLSRFQPIFVLINSFCKTIYDDFVSVQILQATLFYHSFYLILKKLDLKKFYILFFFFGANYLAELSGLRECFGLSFCMYALLFYMNKKWVQYYTFVVAGILCHSGMVIFLALPLVKFFNKLSIKNIVIIAAALLLLQPAFDYLQLFSVLVGEDASILSYELGRGQLRFSTLLFILMRLAVVILFLFNGKTKYDEYKKDFIFWGVIYIYLGFYTEVLPILYRFAAHFAIFYFFMVQETFKHAKRTPIIIAAIFVLFSYTPIARFAADLEKLRSDYYYCSVFSSTDDKIIMSQYSNDF